MKFKVFEQTAVGYATTVAVVGPKHAAKAGFYYHARNGSKVNLPSQRFPTLAHAIRAVEQLWFAFAKAQAHPDAYMTLKEFVRANPIPWARDSLKPKPRPDAHTKALIAFSARAKKGEDLRNPATLAKRAKRVS